MTVGEWKAGHLTGRGEGVMKMQNNDQGMAGRHDPAPRIGGIGNPAQWLAQASRLP